MEQVASEICDKACVCVRESNVSLPLWRGNVKDSILERICETGDLTFSHIFKLVRLRGWSVVLLHVR